MLTIAEPLGQGRYGEAVGGEEDGQVDLPVAGGHGGCLG